MGYRSARSDARLQVRKAKAKWIMDKCNIVNDEFCGPKSGKAPWDAVKLLKTGLPLVVLHLLNKNALMVPLPQRQKR